MDFVAIDFETANASRTSACALGIVEVRGGQIYAEHYWLIDPEEPFYASNIRVHGITPAMVAGKPTFGELWPEIQPLLEGKLVVAHNAAFDFSVLRACLDKLALTYPSLRYFCTYLLGKKIVAHLGSHRLNALAAFYRIPLRHHDALDDARAATRIMVRLLEAESAVDLEQLCVRLGYQTGELHAEGYRTFKTMPAPKASRSGTEGTGRRRAAARQSAAPPGITPGQSVALTPEAVRLELQWKPQRGDKGWKAAALILRDPDSPEGGFELVDHRQTEAQDRSILYQSAASRQARFDIAAAEARQARIVFILTRIGGAAANRPAGLEALSAEWRDMASGQSLVRFISDEPLTNCAAVVVGELMIGEGIQKFRAVNQGYTRAAELLDGYGLGDGIMQGEIAATREIDQDRTL